MYPGRSPQLCTAVYTMVQSSTEVLASFTGDSVSWSVDVGITDTVNIQLYTAVVGTSTRAQLLVHKCTKFSMAYRDLLTQKARCNFLSEYFVS